MLARLEARRRGERVRAAMRKRLALLEDLLEGMLVREVDAEVLEYNRSERALRMVAVGRKNWLFAGSQTGRRRAAILYSLIATAKNLGLDPFVYLRDVLARAASHPMRRIAELTPHRWKAAREGSAVPA